MTQPITIAEANAITDRHLIIAMGRMSDLEQQRKADPSGDYEDTEKALGMMLAHIGRSLDSIGVAIDERQAEPTARK